MDGTLQILLVDDHALFREAIAGMLVRSDLAPTVLEAASASEALSVLTHYRNLDLVLLDQAMPGLNGVDAIPTLQGCAPQTPIVVLSADEDEATVHDAMRAGAAGYVTKTASGHMLLNAVKIVLSGEVYLPPRYLAVSSPSGCGDAGNASRLTGRQLQVLNLLAEGKPNKLIARALGVTEATVKLHVSAILRELRARNRTEAVINATDRGIIQAISRD